MSRMTGFAAAACGVALGLGLGTVAQAAVISAMPNTALTSTPGVISLGSTASFAFTAATTPNGPGAAVATAGSGLVTSLGGGVTDFFANSTIDQTGELYSFSAFPTASVIPFSAADDYIGLSYTAADGVHYGYAELAGPNLVSYGYNTTANTSILTGATGAASAVPEPVSLSLLLTGIAGAALARRRTRGVSKTLTA